MKKKLVRSREQRMIAGVCGGIAEHLSIDVTLVRLGWVVISLLSALGGGVILYLASWLIIPEEA